MHMGNRKLTTIVEDFEVLGLINKKQEGGDLFEKPKSLNEDKAPSKNTVTEKQNLIKRKKMLEAKIKERKARLIEMKRAKLAMLKRSKLSESKKRNSVQESKMGLALKNLMKIEQSLSDKKPSFAYNTELVKAFEQINKVGKLAMAKFRKLSEQGVDYNKDDKSAYPQIGKDVAPEYKDVLDGGDFEGNPEDAKADNASDVTAPQDGSDIPTSTGQYVGDDAYADPNAKELNLMGEQDEMIKEVEDEIKKLEQEMGKDAVKSEEDLLATNDVEKLEGEDLPKKEEEEVLPEQEPDMPQKQEMDMPVDKKEGEEKLKEEDDLSDEELLALLGNEDLDAILSDEEMDKADELAAALEAEDPLAKKDDVKKEEEPVLPKKEQDELKKEEEELKKEEEELKKEADELMKEMEDEKKEQDELKKEQDEPKKDEPKKDEKKESLKPSRSDYIKELKSVVKESEDILSKIRTHAISPQEAEQILKDVASRLAGSVDDLSSMMKYAASGSETRL